MYRQSEERANFAPPLGEDGGEGRWLLMARRIDGRDALASRRSFPAAEAAAKLLDLLVKLRESHINLVGEPDAELQASETKLDADLLQRAADAAMRRVRAACYRACGECGAIASVGASVRSLTNHIDLRRSVDAEADNGALDVKHFNSGADFGDENPFVQTARQDEHGTVPFREREAIQSTGE